MSSNFLKKLQEEQNSKFFFSRYDFLENGNSNQELDEASDENDSMEDEESKDKIEK